MIGLSFRIYLTANTLVAFFSLLSLFGEWPEVVNIFLFVISYSLLFSLPALILLPFIFYFLSRFKVRPWLAWVLLLIGIVFTASIIVLAPGLWFEEEIRISFHWPILLIACVATLIQSASVHRFFQSFYSTDEDSVYE